MLINLKVKTLDAQTHEFRVDNEMSVRQFKDVIYERTNIPVDQQRIIYCGRVLLDDKKLQEYNVEGKVVHVAERPPPWQRGPTSSSHSSFASNEPSRERPARGMRNSPLFRALDGMVVGTMAIPMNANVNHAVPVPVNPFTTSSFCMNRITVARHMLDCANNIAAYLEDPERGLNNTSLDILARGRWTMESTVVEVGITGADLPQNQNIVEMVQGAVSAALRRNGSTNVTVLQLPTVFGGHVADGQHENARSDQSGNDQQQPMAAAVGGGAPSAPMTHGESNSATVIIEDVIDSEDEGHATNSSSMTGQAGSSTSNSSTSTASTAAAAPDGVQNSTSTGTNTEDNPTRRRTSTSVLAEVVEQLRTVQTRLNPFIQQFYDLLRNEPTFEGDGESVARENAQRLYDRVSEAFHYLSHAQHAISDLMLDVSQPAPRFLTCRPILVEQSGYVTSNISAASAAATAVATRPIQLMQQPVQAALRPRISAADLDRGSADDLEELILPPNRGAGGWLQDPVEDPTDDPIMLPPSSSSSVSTQSNGNVNDNQQAQMARLIQAVVNSAPIDTEFHLQINTPSILSFDVPGAVIGVGSASGSSGSGMSGSLLSGAEALRTAMAAASNNSNNNSGSSLGNGNSNSNVSEATLASNVTGTTGGGSSGSSGAGVMPTVGGANQVRVNTATLPTTSTQTRSTSRPQLQISNLPTGNWDGRFIPDNIASFDRFLPCNSHHIREPETGNGNGANNNHGNGGQGLVTQPHTHNHSHNHTHTHSTHPHQAGSVNQPPNAFGSIGSLSDIISRVRPMPLGGNGVLGFPRTSTPPRNADGANGSGGTGGGGGSGGGGGGTGGGGGGSGGGGGGGSGGGGGGGSGGGGGGSGGSGSGGSGTATGSSGNISGGSGHSRPAVNHIVDEIASLRNMLGISPSRRSPSSPQPTSSTSTNVFSPDSDNYLRNVHNQLHDFMASTVFAGEPITRETTSAAIDRVLAWFGNALYFLPQYEKPQFDALESVLNILRQCLPQLIQLLNAEGPWDAVRFEAQMYDFGITFVHRLYSVFCVCVGRFNADLYWDKFMRLLIDPMRSHFTNESLHFLGIFLKADTPDTFSEADAKQFLVHRATAGSGSGAEKRETPAKDSLEAGGSEPMDTDDENPPVSVPLSDAYISGMSAKRRKTVQTAKMPVDINSLVTDSVRRAIHSVGVASSTAVNQQQTPDDITAAIASDPAVQASCKEAVRANVRERLKKDPDFKPDRFPQATKFARE